MLSPRKFQSLPPKTRLRKLVNLIQKAEMDFHSDKPVDFGALEKLVNLTAQYFIDKNIKPLPDDNKALVDTKVTSENPDNSQKKLRYFNQWRHFLMQQLNIQTAEWDLLIPETGELDFQQTQQLPLAIYLEDIRSPFNVGSIFRTAHCFGVQRAFLSPMTPHPDHPRAKRTARGCENQINWQQVTLDCIAKEPGIFALETGGQSLREFDFPSEGLVLIGSEELGLSPEALSLADQSLGRVSIPMLGAKRSLNVSVAFGILMNVWVSSLLTE